MRTLILLILTNLVTTMALATVDPDPDQIGVYFDTEANINCTSVAVNVPLDAFVIITNPSAAEVHGLELHYHLEIPLGMENSIYRLQHLTPGEDFSGTTTDPLDGEFQIGLSSPLPGNGADVVFVRWQFLIVEDMTINFYLGPHSVSSNDSGLPNYEAGGHVLPLGVSSGDINLPVASVNGDCHAIADDAVSFGHVKSLYR